MSTLTAATKNPAPSPRPDVTPPGRWEFPEPTTSRLDNGLAVAAYDIPGQYVLSVRVVVPLSTRDEPREHEGVASLMSRLLDEGTRTHTTDEFTELLERKGIDFGAGLSESGLTVHGEVSKRNLTDALELIREALAEPSFPEKEVTRLIRTRLAEIEQERASAPHRAMREFAATWFDSAERASRPAAGTPETVRGLTRHEVVAFHQAHVAPNAATVVIAGDLDGLDAHALAADVFGAWSPAPVAQPQLPTPSRPGDDRLRIVLVDRPGSVQSEIVVGCAGPDRRVAPAWAAYPVLSFLIGGSPNARVDAVLREDKGFTYGMRSSFRPRRAGGLFLTTGSVRTEVTAQALGLLLGILDDARDGFSAQETTDSVDFIRNTAPARFATADAVADEAAGLSLDGLPPTFTTANLDAMGELTPEALRAAYDRFVDGQWCVVIVGDASAYADSIRALGRGEVSVVPN
ncbi:M16 family metallopeptidase [Nostocoides jenkinsii]|uniref:Putative protease n=2 Tax=Nostocoides jenkinsii TaxID=330834 RepID=A0A077M7D3_9MICO|nr:pitrilysin family protein [Tetrasphaera jenkinsii]CCI51715.1 putative protease [Tetrasphaera jenkinsii Ben 74]